MISWIVKMLLFWYYQKLSQLDPGVKISYDILTPSLYIFSHLHLHPPPPQHNWWKTVVCISYLLVKIYHYIKIILMISWVVIMLLFWHYQKLFQLRVKISYDILTDSAQIINDKVLVAIHICLITSFNKLEIVDQWSTRIPRPNCKNVNHLCITLTFDLLTWKWYMTHHPHLGCIWVTCEYNP